MLIRAFRLAMLLVIVCSMLSGSVLAQDGGDKELEGEITFIYWGNVDEVIEDMEEDPEGLPRGPWPTVYWLVKKWDEMHPNVTVNIVSNPTEGDDVYANYRTQLINGTMPDLVSSYAWSGSAGAWFPDDSTVDLIYDLSEDMMKPNPYGSFDTWREEFWVDPFQKIGGWSSPYIPEGSVLFVGHTTPSNLGQIVIYYNKKMFADAGIEAPPETFAELLNTCDALKEAGYEPLFADGTGTLWPHWFGSWTGEDLRKPIADTIIAAWDLEPAFNIFTDEMVHWAVQKGILKGNEPWTLETPRLLKQLKEHCWQEDWQSPEPEVDYFVTKRTAMMWNGFWALSSVTSDPERDFEFGTFAFPLVTTESSPYATAEVATRHGGTEGGELGSAFMIPQTTVENGNLPIVLDLLQYLTARPTAEEWCDLQWPPCVPKDANYEEIVTDPIQQDQVYGFFNPPMTVENAYYGLAYFPAQDTYLRLNQLYLIDGISLEELGNQLQADYERSLEKGIIDHGWDVDGWPEVPEGYPMFPTVTE
jgi:ABC-type glycerol-3-phosphate transport system substrate-binding protein